MATAVLEDVDLQLPATNTGESGRQVAGQQKEVEEVVAQLCEDTVRNILTQSAINEEMSIVRLMREDPKIREILTAKSPRALQSVSSITESELMTVGGAESVPSSPEGEEDTFDVKVGETM